MAELNIAGILIGLGVVSLIAYLIIMMMYKNHKIEKANELKRENIRQEKELDKSDAVTRGLHLIIPEKKRAAK